MAESAGPLQVDLFGSHHPVGTLVRRVEPWAHIGDAWLFRGDSLEVLEQLPDVCVDVIWADPPYFLSNNGTTCQSGQRASVNKGKWDINPGVAAMHLFNRRWLAECRRVLHPNGTIWVSGTFHVIFSVGYAMQELGFKILNDITWEKPNPPPNLGCRCFTHSHETVLWAARSEESSHYFAYEEMKEANEGKQRKDVWTFPAPGTAEKRHGKHPTQKPRELIRHCLQASARPGALVLDPFNGSGTTGVEALDLGMRYVGIERELEYLELTAARLRDVGLGVPDRAAGCA